MLPLCIGSVKVSAYDFGKDLQKNGRVDVGP